MASAQNLSSQRMSSLASHAVAPTKVALVLLLVVNISIAQGASDFRGYYLNQRALALSRTTANGVDSSARFPSLRPRLGRGLLQIGDGADNSTTNRRPLAVKKDRLDPFDDFHKYRGGFDVGSKHYWGSLAVTGLAGYVIAVGWLVLGFLLLLSICCARCCIGRSRPTRAAATHPNELYFWIVIMVAAVLTMAVIAGSVVLYFGSIHFPVEARKVEHALEDAAENATTTLDSLSAAIADVEQQWAAYPNMSSHTGISPDTLNVIEDELSKESQHIRDTVRKGTRIANKVIIALEATLLAVASLIVLVIFLGSVLHLFGWTNTFRVILSAAWILTLLIAVLFGISFVLDNVVKDICDAMNEYRTDPYNTTLDSILPCQDLESASNDLAQLGEGISLSITQVDATIQALPTNKSYPIDPICQPFPPPTYDYTSTCPNNTIPIGDLPGKLKPLDGTALPDSEYQELVAYANGVNELLQLFPAADNLASCGIVVQTLDKIVNRNCKPTEAAAGLVWDAFVILTTSMILLVLWWVFLTSEHKRERQQDPAIFPFVGSQEEHKTTETGNGATSTA